MKRIFTLTFVCFTLFSVASEWAPVGSKWTYLRVSGTGEYKSTLTVVKDTLIDGFTFRKIEDRLYRKQSNDGLSYYWSNSLQGHYLSRQSNDTLWMYNEEAGNQIPLYVWGMQKNDTLTVNTTECSDVTPFCKQFSYTVDSLGMITIGDSLIRFQVVEAVGDTEWALYKMNTNKEKVTIYEGIGSLDFLFGFSNNIALEGGVDHLVCYESDSFLYKDSNYPFECDYFPELTSLNDLILNEEIQIINSGKSVSVSSKSVSLLYLKLYSLDGCLVGEGKEVSTEGLGFAKYILTIHQNGIQISQQVISI